MHAFENPGKFFAKLEDYSDQNSYSDELDLVSSKGGGMNFDMTSIVLLGYEGRNLTYE